jgi:hypothetical protein
MNAKNRQQLLVIIAGAIVALFLFDKILITPLTSSWQTRSETIVQLKKSIATGGITIDRRDITNSRWNDMRRNTLPNNMSQAEESLLEAFDKWSKDARISVSSIKPQWKSGESEEYSLLECRVDASGELSALTEFLQAVEDSPMALRIESVELASRDKNGQQLALGLSVSGLRLAPLDINP